MIRYFAIPLLDLATGRTVAVAFLSSYALLQSLLDLTLSLSWTFPCSFMLARHILGRCMHSLFPRLRRLHFINCLLSVSDVSDSAFHRFSLECVWRVLLCHPFLPSTLWTATGRDNILHRLDCVVTAAFILIKCCCSRHGAAEKPFNSNTTVRCAVYDAVATACSSAYAVFRGVGPNPR